MPTTIPIKLVPIKTFEIPVPYNPAIGFDFCFKSQISKPKFFVGILSKLQFWNSGPKNQIASKCQIKYKKTPFSLIVSSEFCQRSRQKNSDRNFTLKRSLLHLFNGFPSFLQIMQKMRLFSTLILKTSILQQYVGY